MSPEFTIRPALLSDAPHTARTSVRAFLTTSTGPSLLPYLAPNATVHDTDFYISTIHRMRSRFLDPSSISLVAVTPDLCIGNATFTRTPAPAPESLPHFLLRWVVTTYQRLYGWAFPNRATDKVRMELFMANRRRIQKRWEEERYKERWEIESVSIEPEWQRRGVGRELMGWVVEKAREEGVPVVVEASREGGVLYRSLGFVKVGEGFRVPGGEEEIGGGVFEWWPEGVRERWEREEGELRE